MENKRIDEVYRSLLDNMIEGAQILDFDWKYIYVNDALVSYSSYTREELLGHTIMEMYPGIEHTLVFKNLESCMNERITKQIENEFVYPDGSVAYFDLSIQPIPEGIFIHSVNRTEERKARQKLVKVNRLYAFTSAINQSIVHIHDMQELLENACVVAIEIGNFAMAWFDLIDEKSGELHRFTQLAQKLDTKKIKSLAEDPLAKIVFQTGKYAVSNDVENDPVMENRKAELLANGIYAKIELPIFKKGKIVGTFGLYATQKDFFDAQEIALLEEAADDISFALEVFENNKKHLESEALVLANEKRFRVLIEKSSDMKTLATAEGVFLYVSPSVTKFSGYTQEELLSKTVFDLIHPEDIKAFVTNRNLILQTQGSSFAFQVRMFHKNGAWIWCEGTLTNLLLEPGIEAMVSNFRDISTRKKAEERRIFDINNTNALINNTKDLIWSVDKNLCLITANRSFNDVVTHLRGVPILPGEKILAGSSPEQAILYEAFYKRALKGEAFSETIILSLPEKRWSEISFYPIRENDEIVGTACHSRDITAFKNLEIDLQKKLQEITDYKYALDESSIVAITNQNGKITHVNDNFCTISKFSREELIGQDHKIINSGFHPKEFIREIWTTIAKGKIWKGELKNKAKDGKHYWVDTTIVPFLNENGKPYQYIAIRSDITQRKEMEEQLRKSEEFSREVLNSLSAHIAVVDAMGDIVAVNEAWEKFGIETGVRGYIDSGPDNNYFNVYKKSVAAGDQSAAEILSGLKQVMSKKLVDFYYEYPYNSSVQEKWFGMTTRPFQGDEEMIVVAHDDISQRKFAEEKLIFKNQELEKTNFELDRFVYSVSHDLRSPLTAILGLLSFIEDESEEDDTLEHAKMIRTRIYRLDEYIKNILNYSRNNRMGPEIQKIHIRSIVDEIIVSLCNMKDAAGITFDVSVEGDHSFYSDKQSITTVLENLISNAIKFHDKEKEAPFINVKIALANEHLDLTISDNGIGISPKYHDKIFEMFFRLSGKISGSGIGLYIVKEIIRKLSGTIVIESQENKGTTFKIRLKNLKL